MIPMLHPVRAVTLISLLLQFLPLPKHHHIGLLLLCDDSYSLLFLSYCPWSGEQYCHSRLLHLVTYFFPTGRDLGSHRRSQACLSWNYFPSSDLVRLKTTYELPTEPQQNPLDTHQLHIFILSQISLIQSRKKTCIWHSMPTAEPWCYVKGS